MAFCMVHVTEKAKRTARSCVPYAINPEKTAHLSAEARKAHSIRGTDAELIPPGGWVSCPGGCDPRQLLEEFAITRKRYAKSSRQTFYHIIQSFAPGENVDPNLAHTIGLELVRTLTGGGEGLVATHLNRAHLHNHILVNSVQLAGGRDLKLKCRQGLRSQVTALSNRICRAHGLSTFPPRTRTAASRRRLWGEPIKSAARRDMIHAVRSAGSHDGMGAVLEQLGYTAVRCRRGKAFRPPEGRYAFFPRTTVGGKKAWDDLLSPPRRHRFRCTAPLRVQRRVRSRLVADYVTYCALLSQQVRFRPPEMPFHEYRQRETRLEELKYLLAGGFRTKRQLEGRRAALAKERKKQRRPTNTPNINRTLRALETIEALEGLTDLSPRHERELQAARDWISSHGWDRQQARDWAQREQERFDRRSRAFVQLCRELRRVDGILAQIPVMEVLLETVRTAARRRQTREGRASVDRTR